ncbi:hypothetical protein EBU94_01060 [bacterium]|nr:hypothetical protein [bacterium]
MKTQLTPIATLKIYTYDFDITTQIGRYAGRCEVRQLNDEEEVRIFCEIDTPNTYTEAELSALTTIIKNEWLNGQK